VSETLVIHPGALGDLVLAVPALRALRRARPMHRLMLAAQTHVGALLVALDVADAVVRFERLGLDTLFADHTDRAPDPLLASADRVVCWFGANDRAFVSRVRSIARELVIAPSWSRNVPVWTHLHRTVSAHAPDVRPIAVPDDVSCAGRQALERAGWDEASRLLFIHPGASGSAKRWPADGYARVLDAVVAEVPATLVLHEGPADASAASSLRRQLRRPVLTLRHPTLRVLAGALSHATAYIGNDSGVSHVAAAVGGPGVVLYATGNEPWTPWSPSATPLVVSMTGIEEADVQKARAAVTALLR
jgi:ADP-heptose:LPS heptosyltransferase